MKTGSPASVRIETLVAVGSRAVHGVHSPPAKPLVEESAAGEVVLRDRNNRTRTASQEPVLIQDVRELIRVSPRQEAKVENNQVHVQLVESQARHTVVVVDDLVIWPVTAETAKVVVDRPARVRLDRVQNEDPSHDEALAALLIAPSITKLIDQI